MIRNGCRRIVELYRAKRWFRCVADVVVVVLMICIIAAVHTFVFWPLPRLLFHLQAIRGG